MEGWLPVLSSQRHWSPVRQGWDSDSDYKPTNPVFVSTAMHRCKPSTRESRAGRFASEATLGSTTRPCPTFSCSKQTSRNTSGLYLSFLLYILIDSEFTQHSCFKVHNLVTFNEFKGFGPYFSSFIALLPFQKETLHAHYHITPHSLLWTGLFSASRIYLFWA